MIQLKKIKSGLLKSLGHDLRVGLSHHPNAKVGHGRPDDEADLGRQDEETDLLTADEIAIDTTIVDADTQGAVVQKRYATISLIAVIVIAITSAVVIMTIATEGERK